MGGLIQIGGDLDIIIYEQWSVGVTRTYCESMGVEDQSPEYGSYGYSLKKYFGNSFYIKP